MRPKDVCGMVSQMIDLQVAVLKVRLDPCHPMASILS